MNLTKFIKNNLFIQDFTANLFLNIYPFLKGALTKYFPIEKALYVNFSGKNYG